MEGITVYDLILQSLLDNCIIAIFVILAMIVGFIPSLREGICIILGKKKKEGDDIGDKIDTKLLRLLITANDAIRKEDERYEMYGCGHAFNDLCSLSAYLVRFEARYKKDKDARRIMDAYKEFIQLDKDKEIYRGLEESEYYRVIPEIHPCIKRLINKYMPKN